VGLLRDVFMCIQRDVEWVDLSSLIFCTFVKGHSNFAGKINFTHPPKEKKMNQKNQLKFIAFQCKTKEEAVSMELNDSSTEGR
jgi:hypothetical protein